MKGLFHLLFFEQYCYLTVISDSTDTLAVQSKRKSTGRTRHNHLRAKQSVNSITSKVQSEKCLFQSSSRRTACHDLNSLQGYFRPVTAPQMWDHAMRAARRDPQRAEKTHDGHQPRPLCACCPVMRKHSASGSSVE